MENCYFKSEIVQAMGNLSVELHLELFEPLSNSSAHCAQHTAHFNINPNVSEFGRLPVEETSKIDETLLALLTMITFD